MVREDRTRRALWPRAARWLRSFWYGFLRLFGLDSCPIDQGPWAGRRPGIGGQPLQAPDAKRQDEATDGAPADRSGRGGAR